MWTYSQTSGLVKYNGIPVVAGYSGHGPGVDNPDMQNVPGVGPIPQGLYSIGDPFDSPRTGKFVMTLTPSPDTETFGRSDFEIHGDEIENPGKQLASHGCNVVPRSVREQIAASQDKDLSVMV